MLRVIHSTVQSIDIDDEQAEAYEDAINAALEARDQVRETFSLDEIGQKDSLIALLPYTDPAGAHRWAILDSGPAETDWQDTDDLDEAIATYEEWVRAATSGAMPQYDEDGAEKPLWDETDVEGAPAKDESDGGSHNDTARMIDAQWAHEEFNAAEHAYQQATQRRQIAFAKVIDSWGRGGQAILANRVELRDPTVKAIADKGRQILAERAAAALPQVTVQHLRKLLDSPAEEPVLYLNNEEGLELDVWAEALAPDGHVIISRASLLEMIGDDTDDDTLGEQLDDLQDSIAKVAKGLENA
ncbi:hypothetical protein ACFXI6_13985 [Streptomyces mirabilis]|uniref:hypothetical protein n=1 Tax=Streptomyces mirabilis TaxID=68239 RepID=UPI00369454D7